MTDQSFIAIETFTVPIDRIDEYIRYWRQRAELLSKAAGFREVLLHRALAAYGPLPLVMVAYWDTAEDRDAALANPDYRVTSGATGSYAEAQGGGYRVVAEYRSATNSNKAGITFVNAFELPAERVDEFVAHWHGRAALMSKAPGFRDNRLHHAMAPDARFPLINIAHWDSEEAWQRAGANPAFQQRLAAAPTYATANPALYEMIAAFPPH